MNLWQSFATKTPRKSAKWKHYLPIYERYFAHFVNKTVTVIEVGVAGGGSLNMWKQYFGPHSRIIGIDVNPGFASYAEDQIDVRIGDQKDLGFLEKIYEEFGQPDIFIDDGSHVASDIDITFKFFYPKLSKNGIYLIEDVHTSYDPNYGGGFRVEGSAIEVAKGLVDELNADFAKGAVKANFFTRNTIGIHFYDSVIVFERGNYTKKAWAEAVI